jgi:hypothetical protein
MSKNYCISALKPLNYYIFSNGLLNLKKIILPQFLTTIGDGAFKSCNSLKEVTLPQLITTIGDGAFENCLNLNEIIIPQNVTSIGEFAFRNCIQLKNCKIKGNVTKISNFLFENCERLEDISIPSSVLEIYYNFILNCKSIKTIHCSCVEAPKCIFYNPRNYYPDEVDKNKKLDITFYYPKNSVTSYVVSVWNDYFTIKPE